MSATGVRTPRVTRTSEMIRNMINHGEISVAEARAELDSGWLRGDDIAIQHLAHFVLDHGDDPEFRATTAYCHDCGTPAARLGDDTCPRCESKEVRV